MYKKIVLTVLTAIAATAISWSAHAGVVNVWGERYNLNNINNFYDGLTGHSSSIINGELNTNNLSGVDLLWAVQPSNAYTAAELATMATFLSGGGRIAFMGEHQGFAPAENDRINTALTALGVDITILNSTEDGSDRDATRTPGPGEGLILNHALTTGVNTYNYAAFAPLALSGSAEALMLGSNLSSVMMGYQNVGAGSVFLITDQNPFDAIRLNSPDNEVMFENLLTGNTGAPPVNNVPEPATLALFGLGLLGFGFNKRKKH